MKRRNLVSVAAAVGVVVLCLIALLALPKAAHACSCVPSGSPEEASKRADAVFAGEATSVNVRRKGLLTWSGTDPVTVEFEVSHVWKGPRREILTVETVRSEESCGYEFKEGRKYIVYVRDGQTGFCSRTAPTWMAFADFAALGEFWHPESASASDSEPAAAETSGGGGCNAPPTSGVPRGDVAALFLLAGIAALGIRRRPRL